MFSNGSYLVCWNKPRFSLPLQPLTRWSSECLQSINQTILHPTRRKTLGKLLSLGIIRNNQGVKVLDVKEQTQTSTLLQRTLNLVSPEAFFLILITTTQINKPITTTSILSPGSSDKVTNVLDLLGLHNIVSIVKKSLRLHNIALLYNFLISHTYHSNKKEVYTALARQSTIPGNLKLGKRGNYSCLEDFKE